MAEIHETAVVYPGTVLGEGVKVLEHAVVGKQPTLSPRSTAKREPLPPTEIGDGTVVSTGAIVFAGSKIGARVILGDQSCVRERVTIGDDVVVGRGSLIENDTTIGALTKIQADAYITAYSTLEDNVFIAPCVVTTNDNFMGRTERRHELIAGPTIRRGARIGGGAVLCPGIEIGEEAFVGAGAVVTKDVPARMLVVGNPARVVPRSCRRRTALVRARRDRERVADAALCGRDELHLEVVRAGLRHEEGKALLAADRHRRRGAIGKHRRLTLDGWRSRIPEHETDRPACRGRKPHVHVAPLLQADRVDVDRIVPIVQ